MPPSNHQGFHGTKSQLSSFQTSLQNTEFCDSIRYQMKMFAFVFLGRMPARFFDPCGSEPVLMHSVSTFFYAGGKHSTKPVIHPHSHICLSFKSISIVDRSDSLMQQTSRDRRAVSIKSPVCNPARWKGRESLGSKDFWCQSWNPSYLGDRGRQAVQSLGSTGNSRMMGKLDWLYLKKQNESQDVSSVVEGLPSACKGLVWAPVTALKQRRLPCSIQGGQRS